MLTETSCSKVLDYQQSLLLQWKNSLVFDNASSTKLVHWNQSVGVPYCSWEGVNCNWSRVTGLNLTNESISDGLHNSSSLSRLPYLQQLDLANNKLKIFPHFLREQCTFSSTGPFKQRDSWRDTKLDLESFFSLLTESFL